MSAVEEIESAPPVCVHPHESPFMDHFIGTDLLNQNDHTFEKIFEILYVPGNRCHVTDYITADGLQNTQRERCVNAGEFSLIVEMFKWVDNCDR